jgi:deferrochelatase/peroxidase EfeB
MLAGTGQALAAGTAAAGAGKVPFYGAHQAGIATPAQNFVQFAALDMTKHSHADLRALMQEWSAAAAKMARGDRIGQVLTGNSPPIDTGEAIGLAPSDLTVTFGFGPRLFGGTGKGTFGLAGRRPEPLVDLPAFLGDALESTISGGDLCIQACANDPQVAFHAVHELIRIALPVAKTRWLLSGFGRTGNSTSQSLPRNLMGFQDGTANIKVEETAALKDFVWAAGPESPAWMHGGSYLVARRIEINLTLWDATNLDGQQDTIGREKLAGTVLPAVPPTSHLLLASPARNGGQRMLRRGYSFVDGTESSGTPAAGVLFMVYQRDPRKQFIPIQRRIAGKDALSLYLRHIGSAIFACPPGAAAGGYVGETLLG